MTGLQLVMGRISGAVADAAGRPWAQIAVVMLCGAWIGTGMPLDRLSASFSIIALILTQMVLNQQRSQNAALHLKIDELILSKTGARDEIAGIEQKTEAEIEELRADHAGEEGAPKS